MDSPHKRRSKAMDTAMVVQTEWSTGLRAPAWDRLWRMILSDLGPALMPDAHPAAESEAPHE